MMLDYINLDFRGFRGPNMFRTKINQFLDRLEREILKQYQLLNAEVAHSKEPVTFANRLQLQFHHIEEGETWGQAWDSAWFHLKGSIPNPWKDREVVAHLDFNGEAMVFSSEGDPLQGLTNGSVFGQITRHTFILKTNAKGGEVVDLWVEAAANHIMGINRPKDPPRASATVDNTGNQIAFRTTPVSLFDVALAGPSNEKQDQSIDRHGSYVGQANRMRIALFERELYSLLMDMQLLNSLLDTVPDSSMRYARILRGLIEATNCYQDNPTRAEKCREILSPLLAQPANSTVPTINAVGHAHIDTGWLWPVRETIRKTARTFSSQLELMERYPNYVFGASQPQHYQFVKDHYPGLYKRVKKAVAEGRWELQGGMWVEPDCNLISGESMVRQVIHGKNFFMDEFGEEVSNCWIPDVFGYSASMPQILKRAGIDYFLTQKISWSQVNRFPHTTFRWRGIDGTEVLTHFPPEDTYNSLLQPYDLKLSEDNFKEKPILDEMICLFGVGNGGGGPTAEMIERGIRQQNLEGVPKVQFSRSDDLFKRFSLYKDQLPVWSGELYLEYHRGTFTTQARTKLGNRQLEQGLQETEYLLSLGELDDYPIEKLDRIWKKLLLNQFHDILPGSSIKMVYEVAEKEYAEGIAACNEIKKLSAEKLFKKDDDSLVVINNLNIPISREIELPDNWKNGLIDDSNQTLPVQEDLDGTLTAQINLMPQSISSLQKNGSPKKANQTNSLILENELICYQFNETGQIISAFDKEINFEFIAESEMGNTFTLYEDRPHGHDAWEVDITYEEMSLENAKSKDWSSFGNGPVRQGINFKLKIGESSIEQRVTLNHKTRTLEFKTTVDWNECHKMLRTAFPVNIRCDSATFGIQYGYVKRPTHRNTSWDVARFEVPAQKYVDLSDNNRGVAILNDSKYGHKIHENIMDLNLLRSPTYPDADADLGIHEFSYCFMPHKKDFIHSEVIQSALEFNQPPMIFVGKSAKGINPPLRVKDSSIGLEVVKRAEKEKCWVVRLVERYGLSNQIEVELHESNTKLQETDLMEWNDDERSLNTPILLDFKPFEIRTFKIKTLT